MVRIQVQKQYNPRKRKAGKNAGRSLWINKELSDLVKCKKNVYREWKQEWSVWKEYKEVVQAVRGQVRKVKNWIELNLNRDIKAEKKKILWDINDKRKAREDMSGSKLETWSGYGKT